MGGWGGVVYGKGGGGSKNEGGVGS